MSRIQHLAQRIADHVAAISDTFPAAHLPARNDAEAERPDPSPESSYGLGSFLEFAVSGDREFVARVNGDGPRFTVTYSPEFKLAVVTDEEGQCECCEWPSEVAELLLGIRRG